MDELTMGKGSLTGAFADEDGKSWIVLSGRNSFTSSGARDAMADLLASGAMVCVVEGPLPTVEEVDLISRSLSRHRRANMVSVGGGLVIDTAKAVALCTETGASIQQLMGGESPVTLDPINLVAVPTTAGSGAERTPFSVIYDGGIKHSLDDPRLLPDAVVIDPLLLRSAPRPVAAAAGLDALAHCVESIWACRSTPDSRGIATTALSAIVDNLEAAVNANSRSALDAMAMAASEAGKAIAITRTTAAHALSYHLSSRHGLAHGHAVALTLGSLAEFIEAVDATNTRDRRGLDHVRESVREICAVLGVTDAAALHLRVDEMMASLGLPDSVEEACTGPVDHVRWVEEVNADRLSNNPRTLTEADLLEIVRAA